MDEPFSGSGRRIRTLKAPSALRAPMSPLARPCLHGQTHGNDKFVRVRIIKPMQKTPIREDGRSLGSGRRIRTLTNGVRVRCATITQFRYAQMILYKTFGICQAYFSHFLFLLFFGRRRPPAVESAWYPQALSTSVPCVSTHARRTSDQCFSAASASSFVA